MIAYAFIKINDSRCRLLNLVFNFVYAVLFLFCRISGDLPLGTDKLFSKHACDLPATSPATVSDLISSRPPERRNPITSGSSKGNAIPSSPLPFVRFSSNYGTLKTFGPLL